MSDKDPQEFMPLPPLSMYILMELRDGQEAHGYEIKKRVEQNMERKISAATLYRHLGKMNESGLIRKVDSPIENDDPRRLYYQITGLGERVRRVDFNRMAKVLEEVRTDDGELMPGFAFGASQ